MGKYKNPDIVQEDKLREASKLLQGVTLKVMPFEDVLSLAKKGDFIYMDPPYYPLATAKGKSFTTYNKDNFLENEQQKLKEVFAKLAAKGCLCMESNSDTPFIKDLYKEYKIRIVQATRMINSDASARGKINEVVVTNY
jgi:DNA adenine methylase